MPDVTLDRLDDCLPKARVDVDAFVGFEKRFDARVAQNQDDYNRRYDEMVSRFEATKAERDALAAEIRQRGIRRREFERFITTLESLPDEVTDFSEDLWGSLVEYLTVYAKDDLRFMLPCEVEITA